MNLNIYWNLENKDQIIVQMSQESVPHLKENSHFYYVDREGLIETFPLFRMSQ